MQSRGGPRGVTTASLSPSGGELWFHLPPPPGTAVPLARPDPPKRRLNAARPQRADLGRGVVAGMLDGADPVLGPTRVR